MRGAGTDDDVRPGRGIVSARLRGSEDARRRGLVRGGDGEGRRGDERGDDPRGPAGGTGWARLKLRLRGFLVRCPGGPADWRAA